ncbi:MAG: NFYB/HAP3 family transcription factor subunit [Candidatus Nanohaloarchaeota archaeon QJJ-5]|nr:NFYB/HAP3 family transcription factor subunit [Candidatus Nanohaloarchaeota archaeon QJJ-5]
MTVPHAPLERIMRNAGADRLTEDAVEALKEAVDGVADDIAASAVEQAKNEGRTDITIEDIHNASR